MKLAIIANDLLLRVKRASTVSFRCSIAKGVFETLAQILARKFPDRLSVFSSAFMTTMKKLENHQRKLRASLLLKE